MSKILGDLLRDSREKLGLSLDDAAKETKIQKRYIIDLETEDFEDMPGKVYERGFLKTYVSFLGLDEKTFLDLHDEIRGEKKQIEQELEIESNHEESQKKGKLKIFLWVIIFIFVAFGAVKIIEIIDKKSNPIENNKIQNEDKIGEIIDQKQETVSADIPESEIEVVEETTGSAVQVKIEKKIEIKLIGKTWIQVFINGKRVKEGEFDSTEELKFEGAVTDQIFVKIGNIKNADIYYNGKIEDESTAYKNVWKKTF